MTGGCGQWLVGVAYLMNPVQCSAAYCCSMLCWVDCILRLLVVHLTPHGTLLEREGGRGRGGREGGRERRGERGGREGEEGGGGIHVKCVHGITCSEHTSHNQYMYMCVMH